MKFLFSIILIPAATIFFLSLPMDKIFADAVMVCATVPETNVVLSLDPASGGVLSLNAADPDESVSLSYPVAFYDDSLVAAASSYSAGAICGNEPAPAGENFVGKMYRITLADSSGNDVAAVNRAATVTISYAVSDVNGLDESAIAPYWWNADEGAWQMVSGGTVDSVGHQATFSTTLSGLFALFAPSEVVPAPTVTIEANGSQGAITIPYGAAVAIAWESGDAFVCNVSPSGWGGLSGDENTGALYASGVYTVSCLGAGGSASASVTISVSAAPQGGNSGGGGGGGGNSSPISANPSTGSVVISGRAYPMSKVNVLEDGQLAASVIADPDANFNVLVSGLPPGNYNFSVYGVDASGTLSSPFTFPTLVTAGVTVKLGSVFIAPTIGADKEEVKKGDPITFFGQSTPSSTINIDVHSSNELFLQTQTDQNGIYLYRLDTSPLALGQHLAASESLSESEISSFGTSIGFTVGTKDVPVPVPSSHPLRGDINGDGRVNLVDFSILAYWYGKANAPHSVLLDGKSMVDLTDFSIMAYYWTG